MYPHHRRVLLSRVSDDCCSILQTRSPTRVYDDMVADPKKTLDLVNFEDHLASAFMSTPCSPFATPLGASDSFPTSGNDSGSRRLLADLPRVSFPPCNPPFPHRLPVYTPHNEGEEMREGERRERDGGLGFRAPPCIKSDPNRRHRVVGLL